MVLLNLERITEQSHAGRATALPELIQNIGPVAKVVLGLLLLFSLLSWTIILRKWSTFRRARLQSDRFLRAFRKSQRLAEIHAVCDSFRPSPLVPIFEAGYQQYLKQNAVPGGPNSEGPGSDNVSRTLQSATLQQIGSLESRLIWLATTAAAAPFIGLFGTVWGIIDAFHGLGTEGAATLRAVAPGISEALVTTAAGLFAAIPALIAYNVFVNHVKELAGRADEFSLEFTNLAEDSRARSANP